MHAWQPSEQLPYLCVSTSYTGVFLTKLFIDISFQPDNCLVLMTGAMVYHLKAMYPMMQYCLATKQKGLTLKPDCKWDGDPNFKFTLAGKSNSTYASDESAKSVTGCNTGSPSATGCNTGSPSATQSDTSGPPAWVFVGNVARKDCRQNSRNFFATCFWWSDVLNISLNKYLKVTIKQCATYNAIKVSHVEATWHEKEANAAFNNQILSWRREYHAIPPGVEGKH